MNWRRFFRRGYADAELQKEMDAFLADETDENIARGMLPEEARRQARIKLGNPRTVRETLWQQNTVTFAESIWRDLKYAMRTFRRSPGFTVIAVLVMALGIGANVALFTIVHSVLLKPLPFNEPASLIRLYERSSDRFPYNQVAGGVFAAWKKQTHGFSDLALLDTGLAFSLSEAGGQLPEKVTFGVCSWNLFPMLGVNPALGRNFTASDDQPSANATVMITWGLWKRRFGGDPAVVNRNIELDGKPYTVIGVLPAWVTYPGQDVQLWTPIYHLVPPDEMSALDSHDWEAIGRLEPGVSKTQATAELSLIVRRLHDQHLDDPFISSAASSMPLLEDLTGDIKTPMYLLLAATSCLLLIACLNIANLMISRGSVRRRELAIRTALGGGHWRLVREHMTETFVLSLLGGAAGLLVAYSAIRWFVHARQDMSRVESIHLDGAALAFTFGITLFCALCAGLASTLPLRNRRIAQSLSDSSRFESDDRGKTLLRKGLVSVEVALTVVLLIGAGLMLKSYARLRSSDLGCVTNNVLTMQLSLPDEKYSKPVQRMNFFASLIERVRSLPGVEATGLVRTVPGQGYGGDGGFAIAEHAPLPFGQKQNAMIRWADPGYFHALGIPLVRGTSFDTDNRLDKADQVVISESFAREYFGSENPIGKHLVTFGSQSFQIVGIVGDTRFALSKPPQPMMYFSIYSGDFGSAALVVRSDGDVNSMALPIQEIVQQLDPQLAVMDILTMNQLIGKSILGTSFDATLLLVFAALSLLLAAVGLFGVLSYIAAQRTTEIGIRIALGAQRNQVLRLMLFNGMRPALLGLGFGLAASAITTRMIQSILFGTRPFDPPVYVAAAGSLLLVSTLACMLPAWRASRLNPIEALRAE
ncbi:MAG: ABC transporter permease [Terracidiphilus sp.]